MKIVIVPDSYKESLAVPCSRACNDFGQRHKGLLWVEKSRSPSRVSFSDCVNSFDRHVCFIIGSLMDMGQENQGHLI